MPKKNIEDCELMEGCAFFFFPALVRSEAYLIQMPTIAGLQRFEKILGSLNPAKAK
jgi:hypothetical protein